MKRNEEALETLMKRAVSLRDTIAANHEAGINTGKQGFHETARIFEEKLDNLLDTVMFLTGKKKRTNRKPPFGQ